MSTGRPVEPDLIPRGGVAVVSLRLVRDRKLQHHSKTIRGPADVATLVHRLLRRADRECFVAVCLNPKQRVTGVNVVSVGTLNLAPVHPREVFKAAILANAATVIVAHNHTSSDPSPSRDDILITERLHAAGRLIGIEVLDHVIVADTGAFVSLKERGDGFKSDPQNGNCCWCRREEAY